MKPEQQRAILEAAAKACGFKKWRVLTSGLFQVSNNENWNEAFAKWTDWNPLTNSADTAEMCAKLGINTFYYMSLPKVECSLEDAGDEQVIRYSVGYADNPGEKLKAWTYAATMVAAEVGGYTDA